MNRMRVNTDPNDIKREARRPRSGSRVAAAALTLATLVPAGAVGYAVGENDGRNSEARQRREQEAAATRQAEERDHTEKVDQTVGEQLMQQAFGWFQNQTAEIADQERQGTEFDFRFSSDFQRFNVRFVFDEQASRKVAELDWADVSQVRVSLVNDSQPDIAFDPETHTTIVVDPRGMGKDEGGNRPQERDIEISRLPGNKAPQDYLGDQATTSNSPWRYQVDVGGQFEGRKLRGELAQLFALASDGSFEENT